MKRTKLLALLLAMVLVVATVALVACKDKNGKNGITLKPEELSVMVNETKIIQATVTGTDEAISWSVDNKDVIKLTGSKKAATIRGLKEGTATVTATAGEYTATCEVTVTPDTTEKIAITWNGQPATAASVDMDKTITLVATASQGSPVIWESSNEAIATVDGGVVKGVKPGNVTITAKVNESIKAEVEVTVNSVGGYEYYELTLDNGAADAAANPGKWAYWTEWCSIITKNYDNGTLNLEFTNNGASWVNMQLFNVNSTIAADKYYKLTFDIDSSAAGHVTVNGNVVALQEGKHSYVVYFTGGNGFSMQFGVEGGKPAIDIPEAKVAISNVKYEEDTNRVTLSAPTFTYNATSGVITVGDNNTAGVKHYVLNLYKNGKLSTGVTVTASGEKVDWSMVLGGTYQAKLYAVAVNSHYIDSAESAAQEITVVNEGGLSYSFQNVPDDDFASTPKDGYGARAKQTPGIWTYWSEGWVNIRGEFKNNKLTVTFSKNDGNWYDTQLNYRHPDLEIGKIYNLQLEINSTAGGRVTLNGQEFKIEEGTKVYDIVFTEVGGLSIQFTFGLDGQNNAQEIQAATMVFEIKGVTEVKPTQLVAPSFTLSADKKITITDTNAKGVGGYELGFFQGADLKKTVTIANGATVDPSVVTAGTYTLKLRAVAASALYITSGWSTSTATVTSTSQKIPVSNGDEAMAVSSPDTWIEWHDKNWTGSMVSVGKCELDTSGEITLTYSVTSGSCWHGMQLFKRFSGCVDGKQYTLTLKINSSVAGKITVNGKVVELKVGDNDVSVTFTQQGGKATVSIQFGVEAEKSMIKGGTFTLSNINVTAA